MREASYRSASSRERVNDFSLFECLSPFCFWSIEFHCNFSLSSKILYIFYLLLLYLDYVAMRPSLVYSTVFPKGSVTGCDSLLGGGGMIFHFRLFQFILFFVN